MARPNDSEALGRHVSGLKAAKAAFQALPQIVREATLNAVETTARMIAAGAQARLLASPSIRTKALYNHVKWSVTKTNGRGKVGIVTGSTTVKEQMNWRAGVIGGRKIRFKGTLQQTASGRTILVKPTRYAHLIEFGTKKFPAEPFMEPAAAAQRQPHIQRMVAAGRTIEKEMAAIGLSGAAASAGPLIESTSGGSRAGRGRE